MIAVRTDIVEKHAVGLFAKRDKVGRRGRATKAPMEGLLRTDWILNWSFAFV